MAKRVQPPSDPLQERARRLALYGLLAQWSEFADEPWLPKLIECEEVERAKRSLERRLRSAKIRGFKALADYDWTWPREIDRGQIEEVCNLGFIEEQANVVIVGPNGVGKTTIAQNLAHRAVLRGYTALITTASEMLNDLAAQDSSAALTRRLSRYCRPTVLVIDEVGYLSYDSRHGDLLFEVISRRHQEKPIVLTTNRPFAEWNEVFSNSSCVTALVDRLLHKAEIIKIDGDSYRAKEASERAKEKAKARKKKSAAKTTKKKRPA